MAGTILTGDALLQARKWLEMAANVAQQSVCCRRRCGSVLIGKDGMVLSEAENKLPGTPGQANVHCNPYGLSGAFKSDKACCVHAEQRAVMQALALGQDLKGSVMVFASVDEIGKTLASGKPYCTICSKMALEAGVGWWILEHEAGVTKYEAAAYNTLSFNYSGE